MWLPTGSVVEARVRQREVGVEQEPRRAAPSGCSTPRRRRLARLGSVVAGVADVDQLGVEFKPPQRERTLQPGDRFGARSRARSPWRRTSGGTGRRMPGRVGLRVDGGGGAARVVAVEAVAGVDEELGCGPRAERPGSASGEASVSRARARVGGGSSSPRRSQRSARTPSDAAQQRRHAVGLGVQADAASRAPRRSRVVVIASRARCRTGRRGCGRGAACRPTALRASSRRAGARVALARSAEDLALVGLLELVAVRPGRRGSR